MGGPITIGVRLSNGDEYWTERHTNAQPYLLSNPDLLNEGKALDDYLDLSKFKERGVYLYNSSEVKKAIKDLEKGTEYGCILLDFKTKTMMSRNGYANLKRMIVNSCTKDRLVSLQDAGMIERIFKQSYDLEAEKIVSHDMTYQEAMDMFEEKDYDYLYVTIKDDPIKIDCVIDKSHEAIQWARDNGWAMKTTVF